MIFGICFVVLNSLICYAGWHLFKLKKYNYAIAALICCGFLLRLFVASDAFLHDWDEQFHALVAKNLLNHLFIPTLYDTPVLPFEFTDWTSNHVWLHKQPMTLWGMALGIKLFGVNEWAIRMPTVILSCCAIWFTYLIGKLLFDKKTAWIAAFLHAIHGYIVELTGGRVTTDHVDIYFLVFIELAVLLSVYSAQNPKRKFFDPLIGIAIGLAILTKWLPALIVIPIYILLHLHQKNSKLRISIGVFTVLLFCIATFLPWQLYIHAAFPLEAQWESEYNWRHIFEVVEEHRGSVYYHFVNLQIIFSELIYLSS